MNNELEKFEEDIFDWIDPDMGRSIQKHSIIKPDIDESLANILDNSFRHIAHYESFKYGIGSIYARSAGKDHNNGYNDHKYSHSEGQSAAIDCFKLWFNKDKVIKISPNMYWFHNFLTELDNHLLKTITQGRFAFSFLAASVIIDKLGKYFYSDKYDEGDLENLNQKIKEGESIDNNCTSQMLKKIAGSAVNKIKKDMKNAESMGIGKSDEPTQLETISSLLNSRMLKNMKIDKSSLNSFVKHIVNRASQTVGGKCETIDESIFDAEDIDEIKNIENFLHEALFDDLVVEDKKYYLNFDLYIDDSGSMSEKAGFKDSNVTLRSLSRMFAFKLDRLNLVKDIYLFAHSNCMEKISKEELFTKIIDGGTDIQQCIENAKKTNRPAIIVTDGWDHFNMEKDYYDKVYFVVLDCNELPDCFEKFSDNNQILFWSNNKFRKSSTKTINYGSDKNSLHKRIVAN
jgi:hypothetical protein